MESSAIRNKRNISVRASRLYSEIFNVSLFEHEEIPVQIFKRDLNIMQGRARASEQGSAPAATVAAAADYE